MPSEACITAIICMQPLVQAAQRIVYVFLGTAAAIAVHKALPEKPYRILVRNQGYANGLSGLYIYSSDAVPGHARSVLMDMLRKDGEELDFREPINKEGYRSESDALRLIAGIEKEYEPVDLTKLFRRS
jgi:hypothetical protein